MFSILPQAGLRYMLLYWDHKSSSYIFNMLIRTYGEKTLRSISMRTELWLVLLQATPILFHFCFSTGSSIQKCKCDSFGWRLYEYSIC